MMRSRRKRKNSKRRNVILIVLFLLLAVGFIRFVVMRSQDLRAWPAGAPGVSLELDMARCAVMRLAGTNDVFSIVSAMPAADEALTAEYHRFQAFGFTDKAQYPLIEKRLGEKASSLAPIRDFWHRFDGFDPAVGSIPYKDFIRCSAEATVLGCYASASSNAVVMDASANADLKYEMLENAVKLANGGGILGRAAALNNVMLVVRETIMNPVGFADNGACTSLVSRIRGLETCIGSLADAIRTDLVSTRDSVSSIYADLAGTQNRPSGRRSRVSKTTGFIVGFLGGDAKDTRGNIDALFSRLIQNASLVYAPESLTQGLPDWCKSKARTPWTRDPIGAAVAGAYMRAAVFAHAVEPSIRLELRACRIALALQCFKQSANAYPESLDELIALGLLEERDVLDPYAVGKDARLVYARDGEGWRFYSVGLNQIDDGGLVDAYRAADAEAQKRADFIFISHERESRIAAFVPKGGKANAQAQAAGATNVVTTAEGK